VSKRKPVLAGTQRPPTPYSTLRASTIPSGRKVANKNACRKGKFNRFPE
jgi:hypothetical protein